MFYDNGLKFECTQCSACCRHTPGIVRLSENDINQLLNYLNIELNEFLKKYTKSIYNPQGERSFSLTENSEYDCIFWNKEEGCSVYEARPVQCSTYPYWPSLLESKEAWDREQRRCPGINNGKLVTPDKIIEELNKYKREYDE